MNMISLRVFFFVTLAVRRLGYVRADNRWGSPVAFAYMDGDTLATDIILQNVPPRADRFVLYYKTENCDKYIRTEKYNQQGSQCNVTVKNGTMQTNETIHITQKLDKDSVRLYIELRNSIKVCSNKIVMAGLRDELDHVDKVENEFRPACLNKDVRPCQIIVDFEDKCEDRVNCTQSHGRLTCESPDLELPEDTVHQWYQDYGDGLIIGPIPRVKGNKTTFQMGYQNFDLNTYIFLKMHSFLWKKDLHTEVLKIPLPTNGFKKYDIERKKTYSELERVRFTCENKPHTHIGWIYPTGSRIKTFNTTNFSWNFTKTDHNGMLCCLRYITYDGIIERSVENITVMIYEKSVNQDNVQGHTANENSIPVPLNLAIVLAVVLGVAVILGFLVIIPMKKCKCVKSDTGELPQTTEPQTYTPNNPFYVNLLFRRECQREIYERENIYEEIN